MFKHPTNIKETDKMFVYLSRLMDKPVMDKNGELAGQIYDIIVKPSEVYPQSCALIIRRGFPNRKYAVIPWGDIKEISFDEFILKTEKAKIAFSEKHDNKEELTLRRDILDQQVVDTHNHKVIRVNDVHLLVVDHALMAAHVDISSKGLLRRLGFEGLVNFFISLVNKDSPYLKHDYLLSWKYIQPLSINPASMTIKVDMPQKQLSSIPAADLGEIFLDLSIKHQAALFRSLDVHTRARIFTNVDFRTQKSILDELSKQEIADLLNAIPSDEAADFLEKLPSEKVEQILVHVESKYSKKLSQLLGYSNDSAGGLMATEFVAFEQNTTVAGALQQIKEKKFKTEPAQFVYITDNEGHLVGATNFRRLMLASPEDSVKKAAFPKACFVHLDSSIKEVAYLMEKYKYYVIPVVDQNNLLQGIITVDDILSQLVSIAWRRAKRIKVIPKK